MEKLILEDTLEENNSYKEWTKIEFEIKDDIIHMNTSNGRFDKERECNYSSSGFYKRELTKEDIRELQKYFDYFLNNQFYIEKNNY